MKKYLKKIAIAGVAVIGLSSAPAYAWLVEDCSTGTCFVYDCGGEFGCALLYSYPARQEVADKNAFS